MRVVGYVRVSTASQAEDGLGVDVQTQGIRLWVKDHRHRLVAVKADEGLSGTRELEHRPALAESFALLREKKAHGLVVYRLDRLARDVIVQETLIREVWRHGWELFSTSKTESGILQDDPSDPHRKFVRVVIGAANDLERDLIALRLRAGRARKAEIGGYAYGAPPLGFKAEGKTLVPIAEEQAALKQIRELRRRGKSLREIGDALAAAGYQPKRSTRWHPESLRRIITRLDAA